MELTLREFKLSKLRDDATVMIIGKRGVGKSTIMNNIMHVKRHIPFGIACSGTEEGNGAFGKHMPPVYVYHDYDPRAIQRVIDRQREMADSPGGPSPSFVYLDDCLYDKGVLKRPEIRQLFMNGRHYKIFLACTAQFCGDVPPAIRSNIDYLFVCRDPIIQNRRRIWENFFGLFEFSHFQQLMNKCTENYECLVLDNTCKSNDPADAVYWFKARTNLPPFKVGCTAFWDFARKRATDGGTGRKPRADRQKLTVTIKKVAASSSASRAR